MQEEKRQKISLGNGFIATFILAVILLAIGFFLWKENNSANDVSNSNSKLPSNYQKIKLQPNLNFN